MRLECCQALTIVEELRFGSICWGKDLEILNLGVRRVPLRAKQQESSWGKKDHQEIKTWTQKREVIPALWRALLASEVEGAQHIQVLPVPSEGLRVLQKNGNLLHHTWIRDQALELHYWIIHANTEMLPSTRTVSH